MAKLADMQDHVNIIYYGDGGTGKTTDLAHMANLPGDAPLLYINAEGGIKARPLRQLGIPIDRIEVWPDPGEEITFESLEALHIKILGDLTKDPGSWVGVTWDSVTELTAAVLRETVEEAISKAESKGKQRDRFFTDISDYGQMTDKMRLLARRFRDLPCHFGISALERRDQDDDGQVRYGPDTTPKLANDLFGYVDIVCHTTTQIVAGEQEWIGEFTPVGKYRAKDRLGGMPAKLMKPTFDRILAYTNGEMTKDTDPVVEAARERATAMDPEAAAEAAA